MPEFLLAAHDRLSTLDSQIILDPAMARMRPRDRQLLWLAHAEGYSHREIAEITGLGATSIRLLLFRARRKVAKLLREQSGADRRSRMISPRLPYEKEVTQALKSGHWPEGCAPELRAHVEACADCSDQVLVTRAFQQAESAI